MTSTKNANPENENTKGRYYRPGEDEIAALAGEWTDAAHAAREAGTPQVEAVATTAATATTTAARELWAQGPALMLTQVEKRARKSAKRAVTRAVDAEIDALISAFDLPKL